MITLLKELNNHAPSYIKGGAVRDILMGRTPRDYDFVFVADTTEILESLKSEYTAVWKYDKLDIIGFAKTGEKYEACVVESLDGIHQRCDYTLNGLLLDENDAIIGPYEWSQDASNHILRMISRENLYSDPIRAIRGIRQKHTLDLKVESETQSVIEEIIPKIILCDTSTPFSISRNRARKEIKKCNDAAKKELLSLGLTIPERWL